MRACCTIRPETRELRDGDLCLVDAGCEVSGYASDVTRTFPVNGRFGGEQRAIYEVVLAAQQAALAAVRPGTAFDDPHAAATRVICRGPDRSRRTDGDGR